MLGLLPRRPFSQRRCGTDASSGPLTDWRSDRRRAPTRSPMETATRETAADRLSLRPVGLFTCRPVRPSVSLFVCPSTDRCAVNRCDSPSWPLHATHTWTPTQHSRDRGPRKWVSPQACTHARTHACMRTHINT